MANMVNDRSFAQQVWTDIGNGAFKYVYFDGIWQRSSDKTWHKSYEDQQGVIASEWNDKAKKKVDEERDGVTKATAHFKQLQQKAIATETSLLKQMKYDGSYPKSNSEKIKLWTNVFLFNDTKGIKKMWQTSNPNDNRLAFAFFINSKEFITLYRNSAIYSVLKSTEYGKAKGLDMQQSGMKDIARQQFMDMLMKPNSADYRTFRNAVIESMNDYFENSGVGEKYITTIVSEAFSATRGVLSKYQETATARGYSQDTIYKKTKDTLKKSMEQMLKRAYANAKRISQSNGDNKYEDWRNDHMVDDVLDTLKINLGTEDNPYIVMEITPENKKENVYKSARGASADSKRQSFIDAVKECELKLRGQKITAGFIKNLQLGNPDFWGCVSHYIQYNLTKVTQSIFHKNSKFFTQDWNASVMTGMLGELSAYLTHGGSLGDMSLTGTTADTMTNSSGEKIGLGESFKDLTFAFKGKDYGINVKRYVSTESDAFNLYKDKEGVGINSQYIYRYFNQEEVNLMRFLLLNKDFIVNGLSAEPDGGANKMITDIIQTLSVYRMDYFVRLSGAQTDSINLFYVLNNLTIPASVIYQYIIDTLHDLSLAKSLFDVRINSTPAMSQIRMSDAAEMSDLPKTVESSTNLLRNSAKIKFKGLSLTGLGQIFK